MRLPEGGFESRPSEFGQVTLTDCLGLIDAEQEDGEVCHVGLTG